MVRAGEVEEVRRGVNEEVEEGERGEEGREVEEGGACITECLTCSLIQMGRWVQT